MRSRTTGSEPPPERAPRQRVGDAAAHRAPAHALHGCRAVGRLPRSRTRTSTSTTTIAGSRAWRFAYTRRERSRRVKRRSNHDASIPPDAQRFIQIPLRQRRCTRGARNLAARPDDRAARRARERASRNRQRRAARLARGSRRRRARARRRRAHRPRRPRRAGARGRERAALRRLAAEAPPRRRLRREAARRSSSSPAARSSTCCTGSATPSRCTRPRWS